MIFRRHSDYLDNPNTQIRFHKRMMKIWALTAPAMALVYLTSLFVPLRFAIIIIGFINFVTNEISVYSNLVSMQAKTHKEHDF